MFAKRVRHRHRAGHVHVGGDDRKALPLRTCVEKAEGAADVDGAARIEGRALRPDENVLEIELDVGFDAHDGSKVGGESRRRLSVIDLSQSAAEANWREPGSTNDGSLFSTPTRCRAPASCGGCWRKSAS